MNRISTIALFVFASFATIHSASAQNGRLSQVIIPFAFTVNDTTLPAGEYVVSSPSFQSPNLLVIASSDFGHPRSANFMILASGKVNPENVSKLVFKAYGDRYFLYKVVSPIRSTDGTLPTSKQEKQARVAVARNGGGQPVIVALANQGAEVQAVRISGE